MDEEAREVKVTYITTYSHPLTTVPYFKGMGIILSESDNDCPAVVHNLSKVQKNWAQFLRVLGREGADAGKLGLFYVAVVQTVLLYGSETWVIYQRIRREM